MSSAVRELKNSSVPFHRLPRLSRHLQIDLRIMRDDLYPLTGGGNKARKITKILEQAEQRGCNALVTTGGLQSNHARVTALAAAAKGWHCRLILHGNRAGVAQPRGNLLLMQLAGAAIEVVEPDGISQAMRDAMHTFEAEGLLPFEIPGGGHCIPGALAYVAAVAEVHAQCQDEHWQPDCIVLASGTGTTQAGLVVGTECIGWPARVLGISVARRNPRGQGIVDQACRELRAYLGMPDRADNVYFRDDWVGGGYEQAGPPVMAALRLAAELEGLILDPTYTGKAFAALLDLVRQGTIQPGSKVLFWHTGGLLNLMASDYRAGAS